MPRNCPHCGFPDEGGVGYCLVCGEPFYVPQQPQTTTKKNKTKKATKSHGFIALIIVIVIFGIAFSSISKTFEKFANSAEKTTSQSEEETEYENDIINSNENELNDNPYWQDTADVSEQEVADVKAEIIKYAESQGYDNINVVSLTVVQMPASNYNREITSSYKAPEGSDVFIADFFIDGMKDGLLHVLDGKTTVMRKDGEYKHLNTVFSNDIY